MAAAPRETHLNIPPMYFLAALALMAVFHLIAPAARVIAAPYRYAGIVIIALGLALILWAALLFRRAGTEIRPYLPSTALVIAGPYRFTRNPMYLGMAAILLGTAILLGSVTPFLIVPAFMAVITDRFIRGEEQKMQRGFGDQYLAYKARVRRWL